MSWTDVFPVLTDAMVDEYEAAATPEVRAQMEEWLGIAQRVNARPDAREVVSLSLWWKPSGSAQPDLPAPGEEWMRRAVRAGLPEELSWDARVEPVLAAARRLQTERPEAVVVVHLASDLRFLIEPLADAGCEVRVMKSPSLRPQPGSLWRLLPLADAAEGVSVADHSALADPADLMQRTAALTDLPVQTWRVPSFGDLDDGNAALCYAPLTLPFGTRLRLPVRPLLEAFLWHWERGTFPDQVDYPPHGRLPFSGTQWPDAGFDAWFFTVALYPRLAAAGMLTLVNQPAAGYCLALDLEYAAWANPDSETLLPLRLALPLQAPDSPPAGRKLQFGTSTNPLQGWENYDLPDVDITRRLPFPDGCARLIFLEHVIEHVTHREAWEFFRECRRVLEPGGVLRLAFPDIVRIFREAPASYDAFVKQNGWGDGTRESTVKAIAFEHGHQALWTGDSMAAVLEAQGFETRRPLPGHSTVPELCGVEQHGRAIGDEANLAETSVVEAVNRRPLTRPERLQPFRS